MKIETLIYKYSENSAVQAGICTAEDFEEIRDVLKKKNSFLKGFTEQDIEKRISPKKTLEDVRSIIVFALSYGKKFEFKLDNKIRGNVSYGAIGKDYHLILKEKMEELIRETKDYFDIDFNYKIFVDTGPLVDREVAKRAKIGYVGKSGSLISDKQGSMIFIGYILTSLKLEPTNNPVVGHCGNCDLCIKACPTGAIGCHSEFFPEKCISYLTQCKDDLNDQQLKAMGGQIYGCDICQKVCPKNYGISFESIFDIDSAMPSIDDIMKLSNSQFKKVYGHTAMGWRGKKIIQRNALNALKNKLDIL